MNNQHYVHGWDLKLVDGVYRLTLITTEGAVSISALPTVLHDLADTIHRAKTPYKVCGCCGRIFETPEDFARLPNPTGGEYAAGLWRKCCRCGSTIAVTLGAEETDA